MACTVLDNKSDLRNGVIEKAAKAMQELSMTNKIEISKLPQVVLNRMMNNVEVKYKGDVTRVIDIDVPSNKVKLANGTVVDLSKDSIEVNGTKFEVGTLNVLYSHANAATMTTGQMQLLASDIASDTNKMKDLGLQIADMDGIGAGTQNELLQNLNVLADVLHDGKANIDVWLDDKASETGGVLGTTGNLSNLYLNIGSGRQFMSALEVYVHELYHAATDYVLSSGSPLIADYRRELLSIRRKFIENTSAFELAKHISHPDAENIAEGILKYLSDSKVGLKEFVAYSQSNPAVIARLKEMKTEQEKENYPNLISKFTAKVREMFNIFFRKVMKEPKTDNDYQRAVFLVDRVMKAQVNALNARKYKGVMGLEPLMDKLDSNVSKWVEDKLGSLGNKQLPSLPPGASTFARLKYLIKMTGFSMVNDNAKKIMRNSASMLGFDPKGTIMMSLGDIADNDDLADRLERLQMRSAAIDGERQQVMVMVKQMLREAFDGEITAEENKYLQVLVDIDAAALQDEAEYERLITDKNAARDRSNEILNELRNEFGNEYANYYLWQAKNLAEFMRTNVGDGATLLNAKAIADRVNLDVRERINAKPEVVNKIDKLVSLQAVLQAETNSLVGLAKLMEDKPNGVAVLTNELEAIKIESEKFLFADGTVDKYRMIKGYLKDVYSDEIETKVAPLKMEKELAKEGFKLVKKHAESKITGITEPMGYYVNTIPARQSLHKQAMRYTDKQRIGTTITELFKLSDEKMASALATKSARDITSRVKKLADKAKQGIFEKDDDIKGLIPLLDGQGIAVDYRFTESTQDKIKYLGKELDVTKDIGATKAAITDKVRSSEQNKEVIKEIKEDAKNYVGGRIGSNLHEYVKVGPDSVDPEIKELWGLLPKEVKDAFNNDGFMVRHDLMLGFMGYRESSASNLKIMNKGLPRNIKYGIRFSEMIWKEVVTFAKSSILIRMPIVLASNVMSNLVLLAMWGLNPATTFKLQLDAVRELNKYIEATKEAVKLKGLVTTGRASQAQVKAYNMALNTIEGSAIKELMDAGFYTQIIEDIEGTSSGYLAKKANKFKNTVPQVVRNGASLAWIGKDSDFYKLMETATQYSDFVARYAAYHTFLAKGESKDVAIARIRNAFINYVKPNSKLVEYFNQMGFAMFTKYFVRVQRALKEVAKGHPIRGIFVLLAQEYLLGDIADITDSFLLVKDFTGIFHNPIDTLITAATPHGLMLAADVVR